MHNNIAGKINVITGASSELGEATARHLSELGAVVVLCARRIDRITALAKELAGSEEKAIALQTDVTQSGQVKKLGCRIPRWTGSRSTTVTRRPHPILLDCCL